MGATVANSAESRKSQGRRRWPWVLAGAALATLAIVSGFLYRSRLQAKAEARAVEGALAARRFDEARRRIESLAAGPRQKGEADYYRAWLEVALDRPAEAMASIRKAIDAGYPREPVMVLRAVLQARAGQFDEAEPLLRRASERYAEPRPEIAEALARIYLATFRFADAARQLDRWAEAAPEDARPYLWRNEIEERNDINSPVVINNYRAALRRDPKLDASRLSLAKRLLDAHRIDEGEAEFATYLERNPKSVPGHVGAGQIALLKGDLQGAEAHFTEALEIDPKDPIALRELGSIELRKGRYDSACAHLKTAVEISPYDVEVRYSYAQALKAAGEDKRAQEETAATERLRKDQKRVTDLREALAKDPNNADLRSEVARWLIDHGHEKEGLEWTDLILRQKPGHKATCQFLSEFYTRKGNIGLANFYRSSVAE